MKRDFLDEIVIACYGLMFWFEYTNWQLYVIISVIVAKLMFSRWDW